MYLGVVHDIKALQRTVQGAQSSNHHQDQPLMDRISVESLDGVGTYIFSSIFRADYI